MYPDDSADSADSAEEFNPDVSVVYDLPDSTVSVSIELHPHNAAAFDLQHMEFVEGLRESITTYCQLHHYYREDPDLMFSADRPVSAVQYYVELAFAHHMIDALCEDRAQIDLTRRVLLLQQLVDSLGTAVRRNPSMSQAVAIAHSALQLAEEFDIAGSIEEIEGFERRIPRDLGRYLPVEPEEQNGKWADQLVRMNEDCLDYPYFVFVDDTQSAEEFEASDGLDDKSKLMVSISDSPLTWDDVRPGRRILPNTV